jgi:ketosteroid isomerase-like protein
MNVQEWVDAYAAAWRTRDPDAAAALFADDGAYHDDPFGEPHRGHDGIRGYWAQTCEFQAEVTTRFGTPVVEGGGRRAAVEFWVTNLAQGQPSTLVGILLLQFAPDGRCQQLREVWFARPGHQEPPPSWGR